MARKGMAKVRTGCKTCKIRKIKCDEARPSCVRCRSTGRKCDGYEKPPPGSFSWDQLLQITPSTHPDAGPAELRSLAFFRQMIAPVLSGPVHAPFWTHLVARMTVREPAAKHAVVALSTMYEHFDGDFRNDRDLGLNHYNMAIKHMLSLGMENSDTILLVTVLFVCIESLRGNNTAAIDHLHHGLKILGSSDGGHTDYLAIYRHLSIFPSFFTNGALPAMPALSYSLDNIRNFAQASEAMDGLASRTIRLVRAADHYRLGFIQACPPPSLQLEQEQLIADLQTFSSFLVDEPAHNSVEDSSRLLLQTRFLVCTIWSKCCLSRSESVYDEYLGLFAEISSIAERVQTMRSSSSTGPVNFTLEMGFAPLLHFVVLKCRNLQLRLKTAGLMRSISGHKEGFWDVPVMHAVGNRIIEIEHGLSLESLVLEPAAGHLHDALPTEEERVRDSVLGDEMESFTDGSGVEVKRRQICLFRADGQGGSNCTYDWIVLK